MEGLSLDGRNESLTDQSAPQDYRPTIFAMNAVNVEIDNYRAIMEVWDLPHLIGPNQSSGLNMAYFDAIIICFSIEDEKNLNSVVSKVSSNDPRIINERMRLTRIPSTVEEQRKELR